MSKRALTLVASAVLGVAAAMGVAACGDDDDETTTETTDVIEQTEVTEAPPTEGDPGGAPSGTPGVGVDEGDSGGAPSGDPGVGY